MNILVLNGSPKGKFSITLQTFKYLEKLHPEHEFSVLDAGQRIKSLEKDFLKFRPDEKTKKIHTLYLGARDNFKPIKDSARLSLVKQKAPIVNKIIFIEIIYHPHYFLFNFFIIFSPYFMFQFYHF